MPKPDSAFVRCIYCTRGKNGEKSCAGGWNASSRIPGCFLGTVIPGKEKANAKPVNSL